MGDIADAMIEGDMCQVCGEWLGDGGGFPVTCPGCGGGEFGLDLENISREDLNTLSVGQKKRRNKKIRKIVKSKLKGMSTQRMTNVMADHFAKMPKNQLQQLILEVPQLREIFHEPI